MKKLINKLKADSNFTTSAYSTNIADQISDEDAKKKLKKVRKKIAKLQDVMYAHDRYGVLICLQGMDTAGKDSLIKQVFQKFNARGVVVRSFKTPSEKEHQHDYLWRHVLELPEKGKFSVFNRTHYENVLVTRVHPDYLVNEKIPGIDSETDVPKNFWDKRYSQINNFEKYLAENNVIVLKFFLHISKEEQRNRLLRRLEKKDKNWKFSPADLSERKLWDQYMDCYGEAIKQTSKRDTPWHVIPSDSKPVARYLVAEAIYQKLKQYKDIQYPELAEEIEEHLKTYKRQLQEEK